MDASHTLAYLFVQIRGDTPDNAPFLAVITMVLRLIQLIRLSIHICLNRGDMTDDDDPLWL